MHTIQHSAMPRKIAARVLVAIAPLFVAPAVASAQLVLLGPGAAFVSIGATRISTSDLDTWLDARDYPTFGRTAITIGLGGYRLLSSGLMLGLEAQGSNVGSESYGDGEMGLGTGYATLGAGYALDLSPRVRVYPRIGIGAGGLALWSETPDTLDFEDVLENGTPAPQREPNLARDGVVLDLGAGLELVPARGSGLMVGLRAGWLAGPATDTWEMYEHTVDGGPDASISGPYARVTVGWAWSR